MLRDITLGQYYQADSKIHKLDPRVKILSVFIYIVMLFVCESFIAYAFSALALAMVICISKVPFKYIIRGLRAVFVLMMISALFNAFFTPGKIVFEFYFIKITQEGLIKTIQIGIRFVLIIISSSMLTLTTTPTNLTDGLEKSLGFSNCIKIPVHEIAMMMSIALRFIPILMEETNKIIKAQTARGADFETGGIIKKAKSMIPILIPLFISALKRANDLATAMDARCYCGGKGRTKMYPLKYKSRDYAAYLLLGLFIAVLIVEKIFVG